MALSILLAGFSPGSSRLRAPSPRTPGRPRPMSRPPTRRTTSPWGGSGNPLFVPDAADQTEFPLDGRHGTPETGRDLFVGVRLQFVSGDRLERRVDQQARQ